MDFSRYVIETNRKKRISGRYRASACALALHGVLIGAFFLGGNSARQTLASEKSMIAFIARGAAPPPPPPPPPKSGGAPKSTPHVQSKPVQVRPHTLIAPREIPKELPRVQPLQTASVLPDTSEGVAEADAGVPEGVSGGVAGGEVGGVVGGVVGGTQGGQIGGVVGGQLGGTGTGTEGTGTGGNDAPLVATPPPPPPPPPPPDPTPAPTAPMRVGGDVKAPVAIDRAEPGYTNAARKARIEGTVIVEAIISKSGRVEDVRVLKGLPAGLSNEAEEAVKKWRFKPGTLNGEPIATIFNLTVTFKLD